VLAQENKDLVSKHEVETETSARVTSEQQAALADSQREVHALRSSLADVAGVSVQNQNTILELRAQNQVNHGEIVAAATRLLQEQQRRLDQAEQAQQALDHSEAGMRDLRIELAQARETQRHLEAQLTHARTEQQQLKEQSETARRQYEFLMERQRGVLEQDLRSAAERQSVCGRIRVRTLHLASGGIWFFHLELWLLQTLQTEYSSLTRRASESQMQVSTLWILDLLMMQSLRYFGLGLWYQRRCAGSV